MEVDHVFLFTDTPAEAAQRLQESGLTEGSPNQHPGQGTACRRFFFRNAYLELVWVSSEADIRNPAIAKTRLWERVQSAQTGYSPFGICFRRSPPGNEALFENSWRYAPSFVPAGQYASIADTDTFPAEPMLFEFPFHQSKPMNYPREKQQPLVHPNGFQEITRVELTLPATGRVSDSLRKVLSQSCVEIATGPHHHLCLEFDHGKTGATESFREIMPLSFRW
jgi:hypothetical protein